jgi:hypothetical protein
MLIRVGIETVQAQIFRYFFMRVTASLKSKEDKKAEMQVYRLTRYCGLPGRDTSQL